MPSSTWPSRRARVESPPPAAAEALVGDALDVCVLGRVGYDLYAVEQGRPLAEVEHFSRHLGGSSPNLAGGVPRLGRPGASIPSVRGRTHAAPPIFFPEQERVGA